VQKVTKFFFQVENNVSSPPNKFSIKNISTSPNNKFTLKKYFHPSPQKIFFSYPSPASLLADSDWTYTDHLSEIKTTVNKQVDQTRDSQLEKLMKEIKTFVSNSLSKPLEKSLENPSENMWEDLRNVYESTKAKAMDNLENRLKGFQVETQEEKKIVKRLQEVAFEAIKDKFANKANSIKYLLNKKY
jgi:hypothetical protein